jgi:5'-nucleotidase
MILLINDDGIHAPGLRHLYQQLRRLTKQPVLAVAPTEARSGSGHAITLDRGLTITPLADGDFFGFAIDGTPTDCIKVGLKVLCTSSPRLVVSGINDGPNVGRSLLYSGTVAAAMEAAMEGLPAVAISQALGENDLEESANYAAQVLASLIRQPGFAGRVLNLNLPAGPVADWLDLQWCSQGRAGFDERYQALRNQQGRVLWHLRGEFVVPPGEQEHDAGWLDRGHPTATLLQPQFNAGTPANGLPDRLQRAHATWRQQAEAAAT